MKEVFLILAIISLLLNSCTKDEPKIDPEYSLIGTWSNSGFEENAMVFIRSNEFTDNNCYRFNPDGTLIVRQNSGWCGTPPISYSNYPGSWMVINDTLIRVEASYWGGKTSYMLDVEEVNLNTLRIITVAAK